MRRGESPEAMLERYTTFEPNSGCQIWLGALTRGYASMYLLDRPKRRMEYAHLWNYRRLVGPIPEGMQLDHLCRVPSCINVRHLEPVTPAENCRRSWIGYVHQTVCSCGRAFDYRDSMGRLRCRTCTAAYQRVYQKGWGRAHREQKRKYNRLYRGRERQAREAIA